MILFWRVYLFFVDFEHGLDGFCVSGNDIQKANIFIVLGEFRNIFGAKSLLF